MVFLSSRDVHVREPFALTSEHSRSVGELRHLSVRGADTENREALLCFAPLSLPLQFDLPLTLAQRLSAS